MRFEESSDKKDKDVEEIKSSGLGLLKAPDEKRSDANDACRTTRRRGLGGHAETARRSGGWGGGVIFVDVFGEMEGMTGRGVWFGARIVVRTFWHC